MDTPLVLSLNLEDAILLRNVLKVQVQMLQPESRADVQKILEAVNIYLEVQLKTPPDRTGPSKSAGGPPAA